MTTSTPRAYSTGQTTMLVLLRLLIGWHLLYEGLVKFWNPNWSAVGYLKDSGGWFAGIFNSMANNPGLMDVVNVMNTWGLILVGLGLLLGIFTRWAAIGGIALLLLYYFSHPPMIGASYALPSEGSYLWVNKNLIEAIALAVLLVFPTSHIFGLDRLLPFGKKAQPAVTQ